MLCGSNFCAYVQTIYIYIYIYIKKNNDDNNDEESNINSLSLLVDGLECVMLSR